MAAPHHFAARGYVDDDLVRWLHANAASLDRDASLSEALMPRLAQAGLFMVGVPSQAGGDGGDVRDAALAIAEVAEYSLSAAFSFWGQRSFIEYLLQSPNRRLSERWLAGLLSGEHAGASGLSNAMKFLGGIESLQIAARAEGQGWRLNGKLPWVTNLRKAGFVVAAAVSCESGKPPMVVAIDSTLDGLTRSPDLDLIALRGSNTAAIALEEIALDADAVLDSDAHRYLPAVRPAFLAMQCGMSIGLARASLREALAVSDSRRGTLLGTVEQVRQALEITTQALLDGVAEQRFKEQAAPLFRLRIRLADLVQQAVGLELQAKGGNAYLAPGQNSFLRRWAEAAFIPIVTPSLSQLQTQLERHAPARA